jgi:hypothetical protein
MEIQMSLLRLIPIAITMIATPAIGFERALPEAKLNIILCDTPANAIAYAAAIEKGAAVEEAKDIVGKKAGANVCDKFIGSASIETEKTQIEDGVTYKIIAYTYDKTNSMKWVAIPKR